MNMFGQAVTESGSSIGRITESSGAVILGAERTLKDATTNIARKATSNTAGLYPFRELPTGTSDLTIGHPGFRTVVIPHQAVAVGLTLTLNASLEVGAVTETVTVESSAGAELQTLNSTMGASVGGDNLLKLPAIGRGGSSFLYIQPPAIPSFEAAGSIPSGTMPGNMSHQNTFQLNV